MFHGEESHKRIYLVQVNNRLSEENLQRLRSGVMIRITGDEHYLTPPCEVTIIDQPEKFYSFQKIDSEKYGPHTWLLISLNEGKFRQVRKMMAAVRHRCKRLIRVSIEDILLQNLLPGEVKEMAEKDFFEKLRIKKW